MSISIERTAFTGSIVAGEDFTPGALWIDSTDSVLIRLGLVGLVLDSKEKVNMLADAVAMAQSMFIVREAAGLLA